MSTFANISFLQSSAHDNEANFYSKVVFVGTFSAVLLTGAAFLGKFGLSCTEVHHRVALFAFSSAFGMAGVSNFFFMLHDLNTENSSLWKEKTFAQIADQIGGVLAITLFCALFFAAQFTANFF